MFGYTCRSDRDFRNHEAGEAFSVTGGAAAAAVTAISGTMRRRDSMREAFVEQCSRSDRDFRNHEAVSVTQRLDGHDEAAVTAISGTMRRPTADHPLRPEPAAAVTAISGTMRRVRAIGHENEHGSRSDRDFRNHEADGDP